MARPLGGRRRAETVALLGGVCSVFLQLSVLDRSGRARRHHRPRSVKDDLFDANICTRRSASIAVLFTANVTEKRQNVKRFRRLFSNSTFHHRHKKVK
jgi:hypothetical protein